MRVKNKLLTSVLSCFDEWKTRDLSCAQIIQNNEIYTDSMSLCVALTANNLTNYFSDDAKRKKKAHSCCPIDNLSSSPVHYSLWLLCHWSLHYTYWGIYQKKTITFLSYFSCATAMWIVGLFGSQLQKQIKIPSLTLKKLSIFSLVSYGNKASVIRLSLCMYLSLCTP